MDGLDLTPFLTGFLVFSRMAAMLMALPQTGSRGVPRIIRMGVALPLSAVLYPTVEGAAIPSRLPDMLVSGVSEVALGVSMGFVLSLMVGAVALASEIITIKIGLNMAGMLDPMTGTHGSALGALAQCLATGLFFGLDLHLGCVRALGESLHTLPPGHILHPLAAGNVIFEVASNVLILGVRLAGPLVFFAFLVNLALMVLGRMAPGLQLFFAIGPSFTIIAGILLLGAALPALLHVEAGTLAGAWAPIRAIVSGMGGG